MRRYRVIATPDNDATAYRAEIHAWNTATNTWNWEPLDTWRAPGTASKQDLHLAITSHGWAITSTLPLKLPATVSVEPRDRDQILSRLSERLRELGHYQVARDNALADLPPRTYPGHLSSRRLTELFNVSRAQLHLTTKYLVESLQAAVASATPAQQAEIIDQLSLTESAKIAKPPTAPQDDA